MTASLTSPSVADEFDHPTAHTSPGVRFQALTQVWAIDHPPLVDDISGTTYLSTPPIGLRDSERTLLAFPSVAVDAHVLLRTVVMLFLERLIN